MPRYRTKVPSGAEFDGSSELGILGLTEWGGGGQKLILIEI